MSWVLEILVVAACGIGLQSSAWATSATASNPQGALITTEEISAQQQGAWESDVFAMDAVAARWGSAKAQGRLRFEIEKDRLNLRLMCGFSQMVFDAAKKAMRTETKNVEVSASGRFEILDRDKLILLNELKDSKKIVMGSELYICGFQLEKGASLPLPSLIYSHAHE